MINKLKKSIPITEQKWDEDLIPTLTVFNWVYNHKDFIRESIESILIQKTTFKVEIIMHDDASTDGTKEIVLEYQKQHPHLFKNILQDENQWSQGKSVMKPLFEKSRGKYIALMHGDDYWIDPLKLQKQVDFLEKNPDYKFSMGKVASLIEKTGKIINPKEHVDPSNNETYVLKDYLRAPFSQTSSFIFKNEGFIYPEWAEKIHAGDQLLVILITGKYGKIKYHNESFSVYRINSESVTFNSNLDELRKKGDFFLNKIDELTDYSFKKLIFMRKILHRIYFLTFSKSYFVKYTSKLLFYLLTKLSNRI